MADTYSPYTCRHRTVSTNMRWRKTPYLLKYCTYSTSLSWQLRKQLTVDWAAPFASCCFSYNILFRFLLLVKRVELELQRCWALQMQRRHSGHGTLDSNAWWLRNCMAFIINNLQYYLQVRVEKESMRRCCVDRGQSSIMHVLLYMYVGVLKFDL